ncbi:MAG: TM2 domain-containing protein, partial [Bacteroidales bacterium]|nr:TM2 domain-containing protein [Bacteroidales bacterium]
HRFYNGHYLTGFLQLITAGGLGIWYLIDLVFIIVGQFRDKEGNYIRIA